MCTKMLFERALLEAATELEAQGNPGGGWAREIRLDMEERTRNRARGRNPTLHDLKTWHKNYVEWLTKVDNWSPFSAEVGDQTMSVSADAWVRERRLRPVYELLDSGNNKKVITEVDKLLKKQPTFTCAKVLKALALVRMNKNEEAEAILEPIQNEVSTDDGTIQALSICYRELERPETLCTYLEAACKKEQSEELLTHCFMAQVRVAEYQKQHLTAIALYRQYNKPTYIYWAIASLIVKYEQAEEGKKERLSLQLAERMTEKFITEQKPQNDDIIIDLYVNALEKLEKYEKVLEVLTKHGHPQQSPWSNDDFHRSYCNALKKLDRMEELFEYMKKLYFKHPDEYDLLKQIILMFWGSHPQWVRDFLDRLLETQPNRVVALADLYWATHYLPEDEMLQRVAVDLELIIRYGAEKPSFLLDIGDFLPVLTRLNFDNYAGLFEVHYYSTMGKILTDVNHELFLRVMQPDSSPLSRLRRANRCFGKYLACEEALKKHRSESNMRTKESELCDQLIVIGACSLLGVPVHPQKSNETIVDYPSVIKDQRDDWASVLGLSSEIVKLYSDLYKDDPQDENVPVKDIGGRYMQASRAEYLIFIAATILEYGLERSPHNFLMRILLAKVYSLFGANYQAMKLLQGLDLKHIQWDTLGYLIFDEAITGGLYNDAYKMLLTAENMYVGFKKESMEHVITCYKYCSFPKVSEFLCFRDQIFSSTQYRLVLVERRLMELLISGQSPTELKKVCETTTKELNPDFFLSEPFTDNRDITVLEGLADYPDLNDLKSCTEEMNIQYLKVRAGTFFLLAKLVASAPYFSRADSESIVRLIDFLRSALSAFEMRFKDTHHIEDRHVLHGFWPPRSVRYYDSKAWQLIFELVEVLIQEVATAETRRRYDPAHPESDAAIEKLAGMLFQAYDDILVNVVTKCVEDEVDQLTYLEVDEVIQLTHCALESFSFFRMILLVLLMITKDQYEHTRQASAKKKGGRSKQVDYKKMRNSYIQTALTKTKELHAYAGVLQTSLSKRSYDNFESSEALWKTLLKPSFLYSAFPSSYNKLFHNIKESHEYQLKEITKACSSLLDFIRVIQP